MWSMIGNSWVFGPVKMGKETLLGPGVTLLGRLLIRFLGQYDVVRCVVVSIHVPGLKL